jgi:hypothetical protein
MVDVPQQALEERIRHGVWGGITQWLLCHNENWKTQYAAGCLT